MLVLNQLPLVERILKSALPEFYFQPDSADLQSVPTQKIKAL